MKCKPDFKLSVAKFIIGHNENLNALIGYLGHELHIIQPPTFVSLVTYYSAQGINIGSHWPNESIALSLHG